MKKSRYILLVATVSFLVGLTTASQADLIFTAVGEMEGWGFGYTNRQPATFVFTLTENTVYGAVSGDNYHWTQFLDDNDPPLYSSVTGTGLIVSSAPSFGSTANGGLNFDQKYFQLVAEISAVGPDGTTPITSVSLTAWSSAFNIVTPVTEPVPTPYNYLKSLAGTYSLAQLDDFSLSVYGPTAQDTFRYSPFSLTIVDTNVGPGPGPTPVPEPGTWAAAALLAGGAAFARWRKRCLADKSVARG